MAVILFLPLAGLISGANMAFADNDHGKKVSEAAKNFKGTKGEHGKYVSSVARDKDDDDEDEDEDDDDKNEHGNATSTPGTVNNNTFQALERFIAFLQQQIQVLINRLNQLKGGIAAPVISSVSVSSITTSSANVSWVTDKTANSKVYFSTSSPVLFASAPVVSDAGLVTSHLLNLTGLTASTTYYFVVESVDSASNSSQSAQMSFVTLATSAGAVISSISVSNIASSSATVSWATNIAATSKVYFSTSSPVNLATALTAANASLVTSHSLNLTGLNASTTYYFVVESVDALSNVTRSAQLSFNTLSVAAPVISAISVSGLSSSTATISWTTDTLSTSKVYFSTSTPVNIASAPAASSSTLVTSHSMVLTGLSANTNYFFIIESIGTTSNVIRSSQFSFLTLP